MISAGYKPLTPEKFDQLERTSFDEATALLQEWENNQSLDEILAGMKDTKVVEGAWEGLHFLLTGAKAGEADDRDPLSSAVIGEELAAPRLGVSITSPRHVAGIVEALDGVDIDALIGSADFAAFTAAGVNPPIWDRDHGFLSEALADAFRTVHEFHRSLLADGNGAIVSIN